MHLLLPFKELSYKCVEKKTKEKHKLPLLNRVINQKSIAQNNYEKLSHFPLILFVQKRIAKLDNR